MLSHIAKRTPINARECGTPGCTLTDLHLGTHNDEAQLCFKRTRKALNGEPIKNVADVQVLSHIAKRTPINARECGTPGCTLTDFHPGTHNNEAQLCFKRSRKALNGEPTKNVADVHGLCSYGGNCKIGHREMFAHVARAGVAPVLYLDAADAALTKLLLLRGIPAKRLVPVNYRLAVAEDIERQCPGVTCMVGDICAIAAAAECDHYGAAWFDMCGTNFGEYDAAELVHCALHKFFTLSSRQLLASDQQMWLCHSLLGAGEKIVQRAVYTGCSGIAMNMVFVASKSAVMQNKRHFVDHELVRSGFGVGTVVRFPLSFWKDNLFVQLNGFKTFDDKFIIGAVHSQVPNSSSQFRLTFQLVDGGSMLCPLRYSSALIQAHAM